MKQPSSAGYLAFVIAAALALFAFITYLFLNA